MRVLVTGGTGVIGYKLVKFLVSSGDEVFYTFLSNGHDVSGALPHKLDITDRETMIEFIRKLKPDVVIHTAALTKVDLCETNHQLADKINIEGTRNVVDACKQSGSKIVFISTSAVFDGKKDAYLEEDATNPQYYYGFTKAEGEKIVKNSGQDYLILRTDQPYCWVESWQHDNSVLRVLNKLNASEIIRDVVDWYNTPTFVDNFVEVTIQLMKKGKIGIYHVVGSDYLNRYEMAMKVATVFGKENTLVQPMNSGELKLPTKRVNVNLKTQKAQEDSGLKLMGFEEGLNAMKQQKVVYRFFRPQS